MKITLKRPLITKNFKTTLTCFCMSKNIFENSLQVCEKLDFMKQQLLLYASPREGY